MKPPIVFVLLFLATSVAGCRQPDAAIPAPDEQDANRIVDIGRDLEAVGRGEGDATKGLVDDLAVFADDDPEAVAAIRGFANRLAEVVPSGKLTEQAARQIAQSSWRLVGVTELSDRQLKALEDELRGQLVAVGIREDQADAVVAEMPAVQRAVTTRPRRWYEVF